MSTAFRGMRVAAGFVLDIDAIGEPEARRRALESWSSGARLHALPAGGWLLLLGRPVDVRAERAPGLCVAEAGGAYAAAAGPGEPGTFTLLRHGAVHAFRLSDLPRIEPASWLEAGGRTLVAVEPLDRPPAPIAVVPRAEPEAPDLRKVAKVGKRSPAASEAARELMQPSPPARSRNLLGRLLLRSPAGALVGRRHRRYLEQLTRAFERHEFDKALREAIGIGGAATGRLLLRLPSPRRGRLSPSPRSGAGGQVPWGPTVFEHLSTLYRRAAEQLERDGDIEGAAFVHADLLDAPRDAVTLLERHGRFALAAELAEGRDLDPDLVVRLWWVAGDRRRAVEVARARGAWSAAIERLQTSRPEEAAGLRAEWVAAARRDGDHRQAVEAAWPDAGLRAQLGDDLRALRERGGRTGARALVRQLALRPDESLLAEAAALIGDGPPHVRSAFTDELSRFPASEPAADRQLATQALRALLREGGPKDTRTHLLNRVDPLLRADLPPWPQPDPRTVPLIVADAEPGGVTLRDAVVLDYGLLVATGEQGVQLLTLDGRPRGHWGVPADGLCVADHGDSVLAVERGESVAELHRLDLATRRWERRGALARTLLADSFDGGTVTTLDADGLAAVDVTDDHPRELWRDLEPDTLVVDFARSPLSMSAIVDTPLQGRGGELSLERWCWDLPTRRLRRRALSVGTWDRTARITASGTLLWIEDGMEHRSTDGQTRTALAPDGAYIAVSGDVEGLVDPNGPRVVVRRDGDPHAVVEIPAAETLGIRAHADVVTVWSADGRVVAVDLTTREPVANLTVRSA